MPEREYVTIYFRADQSKRLFKRESYDILTYLGDLGGLMDVLLMLGKISTSIFATKLLSAALISKLYRVQAYTRDFTQFYETKDI